MPQTRGPGSTCRRGANEWEWRGGRWTKHGLGIGQHNHRHWTVGTGSKQKTWAGAKAGTVSGTAAWCTRGVMMCNSRPMRVRVGQRTVASLHENIGHAAFVHAPMKIVQYFFLLASCWKCSMCVCMLAPCQMVQYSRRQGTLLQQVVVAYVAQAVPSLSMFPVITKLGYESAST
jgi:hypothetical protein